MVECRALPSYRRPERSEGTTREPDSTTHSYRGDPSNRFISICEDMAMPGELFSDEILSCLDHEDSEKELDILMLAASQQYESSNAPPTDNNSARAFSVERA